MIDADYRFGWRWLLPIAHGDQVLLLGFTEQELEFWQHTLADVGVTENTANATVLIVANLLPDCAGGLDYSQLRSMCVIGSGKVVAAWRRWMAGRFAVVSDYALLPPVNPRVVVPLGKSEWVVQGLALHRPGRFVARLAVVILKSLARSGVVWPLRTSLICIASNDSGISPQGVQQSGVEFCGIGAAQSFALYLGTPDDNRKTVILPLGGRRQEILKLGKSPKARAAIRNEADSLRALRQTTLSAQVPELFEVVDRDGQLTLHQEYRPRHPMTTQALHRVAVDFLVELSRDGRSTRPLCDVLDRSGLMTVREARVSGQEAYARLRERLDSMAETGAMVWGHRSHGDFAPWNCTWTSKGYFVFDWEESQPWELALGDAFYFVLSSFVHVHKNPNFGKVLAVALEFASKVAIRSGLIAEAIEIADSGEHCEQSAAIQAIPTDHHNAGRFDLQNTRCETDVRVYLALWLLRRHSPAFFYGELAVRLVRSWSCLRD